MIREKSNKEDCYISPQRDGIFTHSDSQAHVPTWADYDDSSKERYMDLYVSHTKYVYILYSI